MKTNEPKSELDELNLITLAQEYADEDKARGLLERLVWPNGPVCPHCKHDEVYAITPKATSKSPSRKGLYKCSACREKFSVTVGTVFEGSHVPISKWVMAMFIICSSKKSISANQLHRMLKVQYKTAWFMAHRIRFAMGDDVANGEKLTGIVEADETFIGGKGDRSTRMARQTPVVALIERGGKMKARVVSNVTHKNIGKVLHECVDKKATVNTDESLAYRQNLKDWKRHDRVVHSRGEYSRKNADGTTSGINHCESFFSLLKRGVYGAWHHISREHLQKYTNEFAFRWNTRYDTDGNRMEKFATMIGGKRLTYRQAV